MNAIEQVVSQSLPSGGISRGPSPLRASVCLECGTPVPAELVDMARLDLLLLTDRPLRFGTVLQTAIFCDLMTGVSYNRAVVHFCRATHRGWEIGAFLTSPVPDFLSGRFMDDMRGQLRYECDWRAWILCKHDGRLDPVRIISYSINGMRMESNRTLEVGSEFSIFSSAGSRNEPILNGKIGWCRGTEGAFVAGCMVPGQRGRELPRMFGNLTAIHVQQSEAPYMLHSGESPEMLLSKLNEPERFLPVS